ncbi:hypothetical protein SAMN04488692_11749 [Halarsenatibacter silvermanii]|uniref:Uncharacterized protein n=2 Tax=Halarsenatibacter silvermanii TaxID=321763 RepID=A0A1G9QNH6_9FIRM|nr:hypothetical protein SAMN04488692_11749 [Halarsenatibacter silvermanii]
MLNVLQTKVFRFCTCTLMIILLILPGFSADRLQAADPAEEAIPSEWQEISRSLAENNTRYEVTEAIISGLDELMRREDRNRIMLYLSLLEEFQRRAENEPENFEPERNLPDLLTLLADFSQHYNPDEKNENDFRPAAEKEPADQDIYSRLEELSSGNITADFNIAELYLDLKKEKYREKSKIFRRLEVRQEDEAARAFFELAEALTVYLGDEQDGEEIQDENISALFGSILQEEIRDDVSSREIKDTMKELLGTAEDFAEPDSKTEDDIKRLREKIR